MEANKNVVLITGGLNGIGHSITESFANAGYSVVVFDKDTSKDINCFNVSVRSRIDIYYGDVSDKSTGNELFDYINDKYGKLDVFIANAGILIEGSLLDCDIDDYKRIFEINTLSVLLFMQLAAKLMKANRFGRILIASSFATFIPSINSGLYASSKIALDSLVRVMAAELGNYNITVNSYAPGMIPTGMSGIEKMEDFKKERMINTLAINRFGSGHQIAELLLFLASPRSEYITGTKIDISGGKFCVQFKD